MSGGKGGQCEGYVSTGGFEPSSLMSSEKKGWASAAATVVRSLTSHRRRPCSNDTNCRPTSLFGLTMS